MAKKEVEKKALKKGLSKFNLVGTAKLNNYTFKLDEESQKSDWIYSSLNLGVDCGNGNTVYAEMMGGYGAERDNIIYVHGKKPQIDDTTKEPKKDAKGNVVYTDDFDNQFTIDWDDRKDVDILKTIGDLSFITVGLEQTENKKDNTVSTVYEKFLSAYDAIEYISEHLEDGMVINVSGNLKYQKYEDKVNVKKEITSIALSKAKPEDYKAVFQQTILLDKDSIGKLDSESNSYPISARVIDYIKVINNGKEVYKGNAPFYFAYEYEANTEKPEITKVFIDKVLKVKKDITEIAIEGDIVEGSALVDISDADLDDEILALIEAGILDRETVANKQAVGTKRVRRWIIKQPVIKKVKNGETSKVVVIRTEQQYTENDLDVIPFMDAGETPFDKDTDDEKDESNSSGDDMSWLDAINSEDESQPFN